MKKVLFLFAISSITLVSCKKDYTCACTTTVNSNGQSNVTTGTSSTGKMSKSDAEEKCNTGDLTTNVAGVNTTVACEIQ